MTCPNCNQQHGCGCQARKASNGASVCTSCITKYETNLKAKQLQNIPGTPHVPQNVQVRYNPNQ